MVQTRLYLVMLSLLILICTIWKNKYTRWPGLAGLAVPGRESIYVRDVSSEIQGPLLRSYEIA